MTAQPKRYLSVDEYLAGERSSDVKHEYFAGEVFALAGGSATHNRISGNVYASLHNQLRTRDCSPFTSDMRVLVPTTGLYTYPDVSVVCGSPTFADEHEDILLNPILLVEVLSPSTEHYDRGKKFQNYRTIASFQEYLLISQESYHVEHYIRQDDHQWLFSETNDRDDKIQLVSIDCYLALADIYNKVTIDQT
jgi:Uma2 family endonuclease